MKVLFVTLGFPPRGRFGTEFYTHQVVHGLRGRGHALEVMHPVRDGERERYSVHSVLESGVPVHLLENAGDGSKRFEPSYRDAGVERAFGELLDSIKPDLVHFTYLLWGLSVGMPAVAKARGIPSVITLTDYGLLCHRGQMFDRELHACGGPHAAEVCARCIREPGEHDAQPLELLFKRWAVRGLAVVGGAGRVVTARDVRAREEAVRAALDAAEVLIAPTAQMQRSFERAGVPSDRFEQWTYAFDEEPYAALRQVPPPQPPRFGFLAQFAPHKGLATLLQAARLLHQRDPERPWQLVLHGSAPEGRHRLYAQRVLAADTQGRVQQGEPFEPEDAPRIFSGFSAIVLPSEWDENAPLSVLQARSLGVPVLGTAVPGIAEAMHPEAARRLVPVGDAAALAESMWQVLEGRIGRDPNPGLAHTLTDHLDKIEALYQRITRTRG